MMCRFILDMMANFKLFRKVKIQHGHQNVIIPNSYSLGDRSKNWWQKHETLHECPK